MNRLSLGCTTPLYEITERMMKRITYSTEFNALSEIDISIPGGGLSAYYHVGVFMALNQLKNKVNVRRVFGTSSGAVGGVAFACNTP
jgi:predicted acylesterase/phospholipase RssA